jgi:hypothetical protein
MQSPAHATALPRCRGVRDVCCGGLAAGSRAPTSRVPLAAVRDLEHHADRRERRCHHQPE